MRASTPHGPHRRGKPVIFPRRGQGAAAFYSSKSRFLLKTKVIKFLTRSSRRSKTSARVPRDPEGRSKVLLKVADLGRPVSAARLESEGPEGNLPGTGSQVIGGRQGPGGDLRRPVGAPARVTRPEKPREDPDKRRRLSKGGVVEESGQEAQAGLGRKLRVGTAGTAWTPNPAARRGAGRAGKPLGA